MKELEVKNIKMDAVPGTKTIEVESVLVDTNMTKEEFYLFVEKISKALSSAADSSFDKYRKSEKALETEEDTEKAKNLLFMKNYYSEEWRKYGDVEELFKSWLKLHEDWKGEEE